MKGFALDPAEKLIFYTGKVSKAISVRTYDGKHDKIIIYNAYIGYAIDIDRKQRLIYIYELYCNSLFLFNVDCYAHYYNTF